MLVNTCVRNNKLKNVSTAPNTASLISVTTVTNLSWQSMSHQKPMLLTHVMHSMQLQSCPACVPGGAGQWGW